MKVRSSGAREGFTLVEVLAAIFVIGIVLPVLMYGISLATTTAGVARHRTEAATLARQKLDEILTTVPVQSGAGDFGDRWPEYHWSADVMPWNSPVVDGLNSTIQEVHVSVTWSQRGQPWTVTLSTLSYQSGGATP